MFEQGDQIEVPEEPLEPVYAVLDGERKANISCSGSSKHEFCFLCSYSGSETEQLQEYIDSLVQSGRELNTIAVAVHKVRNFVVNCVWDSRALSQCYLHLKSHQTFVWN
jgi:hypothetical protein